LNPDTWLYWYWGKEVRVEPGIPRLADMFKGKGVSSILDVGCGTCRHTIYMAKQVFRVSAFDQSEAAINRARTLLAEKRVVAKLLVWDMTRIPYPSKDSAFDAVIAVKVIHHTNMGTIKRIVGEMLRVTREGGYLYVQSPTYEKAMRQKVESAMSEELKKGTFLPLKGEERGIVHHHFTKKEFSELFKNIVDLRVREEHYCLTAVKH
jgi:ubiquinone/menaquinone biosynthesis C-methylase UbiE